DHLLFRKTEPAGQFARRRGPSLLLGDRILRTAQLLGQFLRAAGYVKIPAVAAQVVPELAQDGRRGKGAEPHVFPGIEAIDGLDEAEHRYLAEVLLRGPLAAKPAG